MKINNKTRLFIFVLGITCVTIIGSCKKGYLDVRDPNVYSSDNYPATIDDINIELNDLYGRIRAGFYDPVRYRFFSLSRDHSADQAYQAPDFNAATQLGFNKTSEDVSNLWNGHYENIAKCVNTLNDIVRFKTKNPVLNTDETESLNLIEGQALFIRAWNYMTLINFFGQSMITSDADKAKLGIPIIFKLATSIAETQVPRSTVGQVWDYIIEDLKKSESLLGSKVWSGNEIARVSGWAAKALLGKAYIYSQQWALANTKLKEVVDNSGKSLVPFDEYKEMFNGQYEFNNESLFELNLITDKNEQWNNQQNIGTRLSVFLGPAYINDDGDVSKNGFGNYFIHEKNLLRFGFTGTAVTAEQLQDPVYLTKSRIERNTKVVDPRLWVVAFQPYLDSLTFNNVARPSAKVPGDGVNLSAVQAWSWRKFVLKDKDWSDNNVSTSTNMYVLRLADIYLLYAEALIKTGNNAGALEYINKVHRRAYSQADVNSPGIYDYTSLSAATKAPDASLKNDPLKYERWAELFGEGTWWLDVARWKLGSTEASFYQKVATGSLSFEDYKYALPIPLREMNTNTSMVQNPNY